MNMKILKAGRFVLQFESKKAKLAFMRHVAPLLGVTFAKAKKIAEGSPFSFSSLTEVERKNLINFAPSGAFGWIHLHIGQLVRVPWPFQSSPDYAEAIREEFGFSLTPPEEDNSDLLFDFESVLSSVRVLVQPGAGSPKQKEP